MSEYIFVEKVSREGEGPTRHGDAVACAALCDGRAAQEGRVRHHRGRRHGDPSGHLYASLRADRHPAHQRHEDSDHCRGRTRTYVAYSTTLTVQLVFGFNNVCKRLGIINFNILAQIHLSVGFLIKLPI